MSAMCFRTLFGIAVASLGLAACGKPPVDDPLPPPKPKTVADRQAALQPAKAAQQAMQLRR